MMTRVARVVEMTLGAEAAEIAATALRIVATQWGEDPDEWGDTDGDARNMLRDIADDLDGGV